MQHDLFVNPSHRGRAGIPARRGHAGGHRRGGHWIVVTLTTTVVVPNPLAHVLPLVSHDGRDYVVMMRLMEFLPARRLGSPAGSIAQYRDDISRALDLLFFGI